MIKNMIVVILGLSLMLPATAWGPKTQLAISTAAMHLVSKEGNLPLAKMGDSVRRGAMESQATMTRMYPDMFSGPVQAIESEMLLLKTMRGTRLDNYFAYRMGLLGKLVAQTTSPMATANPSYRNLYYTDVERTIESTELKNRARESVDPVAYFSRRINEANANNDVIQKDYENGVGIGGVAGSLVAEDTSRSVRAVADVWTTILTERAVAGNISDLKMREYALEAMKFYIARKNTAAMDAAEERYAGLVPTTAEYLIALGDAYFEAELNERAIGKYKDALAMDPGRRDVVGRIADYYVDKGNTDLENERLEAALEAYTAAVDANPLHNSAEGDRLHAAKLIKERDGRMEGNQTMLDRAEQLVAMAEQEALGGHSAEAIDLLREAESVYSEVSNEFPLEATLRDRGLSALRIRVQELKQNIMVNASNFSGTAYVQDVKRLVENYGQGMDEAGLKAILQRNYDEEYNALSRELSEAMRIQ